MVAHGQIEPGAAVEATDGRFGTVKSVIADPRSGELWYLLVRRDERLLTIPASLIAEVVGPHEVRLGSTSEALLRRIGSGKGLTEELSRIRIPIHEERLRTAVRPTDLGELRIHKTVEHVPETVTQAVNREELEIERVPLDRLIDEPAVPRQEGEWLVVPVMEEVLVVTRQLVLTEEVRIRTKWVTEEQEVYEVLRREHVSIEDATRHGVHGRIDAQPVRLADEADERSGGR
jgi:uncharacterized protein (TIGR02271 family)